MISSSHEVVTKRKVSIPSFLSWPPSIANKLVSKYTIYRIVRLLALIKFVIQFTVHRVNNAKVKVQILTR